MELAKCPPPGRPRGFDREAALETALQLFWQHGYEGVSIADLTRAIGIAPPSLYAAFGSKEALYLEAMEHYEKTTVTEVWGRLTEGPTVRGSIEKFLQAAVGSLPECGTVPGGCMATLAALGEEYPGAIPKIIKKNRLHCLEMLLSRLNDGLATGELPSSTDVERWSRFYLAVFQGMAVQARDGATAAELDGLAQTAMAAWPGSPVATSMIS